LAITVFIIIFGYFCNFMSSDLVTKIPAEYVDSIDYFVDTKKPRYPIIMKNFFFDAVAKRATEGSKLYKLNQLVRECEDDCLLEFSSDPMMTKAEMDTAMEEVLENKAVVIYPEYVIRIYAQRVGCSLNPAQLKTIHFSKDHLTPGSAHLFFSWSIPADQLKYMEYRVRNALEFDFFNRMVDFLVTELIEEQGIKRTLAYYRCFSPVDDEDSTVIAKFSISSMSKGLRLFGWIIVASFVILVIEIISGTVYKIVKGWRKHRVVVNAKKSNRKVIKSVKKDRSSTTEELTQVEV